MKRNNIIIAVLAIAVVFMTACTPKTGRDAGDPAANMRGEGMQMPDVVGEVTEVIGNQITLKEIKTDMMRSRMSPDPNRTFDPNRTYDPNRTFDPNGEPGAGRRFEGGERTAPETEYTGEMIDIVIPAGMKIKKTSMGTDGKPTEEEVALSVLKKGDRLSVTYVEGTTTVESVTMGGMMMRFSGGEGGGRPGGDGDMIINGERIN